MCLEKNYLKKECECGYRLMEKLKLNENKN